MTGKNIWSSGIWQHKSPGRNDMLSGRRLGLRSMGLSSSRFSETAKRKKGNLLLGRSSWQGQSRSQLFFPGKTLALKMPTENTREDLSYEMANVTRVREAEASWAQGLRHQLELGQESHLRRLLLGSALAEESEVRSLGLMQGRAGGGKASRPTVHLPATVCLIKCRCLSPPSFLLKVFIRLLASA